MSTPFDIPDDVAPALAELRALGLSLARDVTGRMAQAETSSEVAELCRAFDRVSGRWA